MKTWVKVAAYLVVGVLIFVSGYRYAASIYKAEIAQLREEHAQATKELTDEYRERERSQAQQLADAWDALERARAESVSLRDDGDRVRVEADHYRAELSRANSDSCTPFRKRLARCTDLLAEGASLSSEGAGLAERVAARKDAVVKIYSTQ